MNKPKVFLTVLMALACSLTMSAQKTGKTTTVTGHVYDAETKEPLPGVAVMQKASNIGAITDTDGLFVLGVSNVESQLVTSYLGYKDQTVNISGRKEVDIYLEVDAESLEDAVVVGYGTQKKATVTGALTTVDSKQLTRQATPNFSNAKSEAKRS